MIRQWAIAIGITAISSSAIFGYNHFFSEPGNEASRPKMPQSVKASPVEIRVVEDLIKSMGTVSAAEKTAITPKVSGYIKAVHVQNREWVEKNSLIFTIENSEAKSQLDSSISSFEDARTKARRIKSLVAKNMISKSDLDDSVTALKIAQANMEIARNQYEHHEIRAAIDGFIDIDELSEGEYLSAGEGVGSLKNSKAVDVRFYVPQNEAHKIQNGQRVRVYSGSKTGLVKEGEIIDIATSISPDSRMLRIKARIENDHQTLIPGEAVRLELVVDERETFVVNEEALLMKGSNRYLFLVDGDTATQIKVETGVRANRVVEISKGVDKDSLIVIEGQDRLTSGDSVKVLGEKE